MGENHDHPSKGKTLFDNIQDLFIIKSQNQKGREISLKKHSWNGAMARVGGKGRGQDVIIILILKQLKSLKNYSEENTAHTILNGKS